MIEIERKFLVKKELIDNTNVKYIDLIQGYITKNEKGAVRARIEIPSDDVARGFLMSKTKIDTLSNYETVDEISVNNAEILIGNFSSKVIKKRRYLHLIDGFLWEVDFFSQPTELVLAEIELTSADQKFTLPDWIDREVTGQSEYSYSKQQKMAAFDSDPKQYPEV